MVDKQKKKCSNFNDMMMKMILQIPKSRWKEEKGEIIEDDLILTKARKKKVHQLLSH
jgi:hypothetical protein